MPSVDCDIGKATGGWLSDFVPKMNCKFYQIKNSNGSMTLAQTMNKGTTYNLSSYLIFSSDYQNVRWAIIPS